MVTAIARDVATVELHSEKIDRKEQGIDEQLEQFFASTTKVQKLFRIEGSKVGIFFDPSGAPIKVGFGYTTVRDKVALASEDLISQQVTQKIKAKIPSGCTYSTVIIEKINGIPFFQFLGLE